MIIELTHKKKLRLISTRKLILQPGFSPRLGQKYIVNEILVGLCVAVVKRGKGVALQLNDNAVRPPPDVRVIDEGRRELSSVGGCAVLVTRDKDLEQLMDKGLVSEPPVGQLHGRNVLVSVIYGLLII